MYQRKKTKTVYQQQREKLGLSREKASELLEFIPPERIERIESEKSLANPDEVLIIVYSGERAVVARSFSRSVTEF